MACTLSSTSIGALQVLPNFLQESICRSSQVSNPLSGSSSNRSKASLTAAVARILRGSVPGNAHERKKWGQIWPPPYVCSSAHSGSRSQQFGARFAGPPGCSLEIQGCCHNFEGAASFKHKKEGAALARLPILPFRASLIGSGNPKCPPVAATSAAAPEGPVAASSANSPPPGGSSWDEVVAKTGHEAERRAVDKSESLVDAYGHVEEFQSSPAVTTRADATLESILELFEHYTGLPVVDAAGHCVGIVSNIDVAKHARSRADSLPTTRVAEVMSSPAFVILEHAPVAYAAGLMLKHKVHRLPVVNTEGVVVGIITRTDLYEPLIPPVHPLFHRLAGVPRKDSEDE
eukprot:jgi/Mesen1/6240/ME000322S05291